MKNRLGQNTAVTRDTLGETKLCNNVITLRFKYKNDACPALIPIPNLIMKYSASDPSTPPLEDACEAEDAGH